MGIVAVLGGPTASGKSALALRWARARGLEIISADSRQIYRGFHIGTGAPTPEELSAAPHHFTGHVDPSEAYSPRRFRAAAEALVQSRPGTGFLVVGGTGLYLKEWMFPTVEDRGETPPEVRAAAERELTARGLAAVHADLLIRDPGGMEGVAPQDSYRLQKRLENWLLTGRSYARPLARQNPLFDGAAFLWLDLPRARLHANIEARVRDMFARGWVDEVRALLRRYDPANTPAFNALGYREIAEALRASDGSGDPDSKAVIEKIVARTRQYAKKQTTFFRHQFPEDRLQRLESAESDTPTLFSN